jgi:O-antigen/teichoic acid export membrane protein
MGIIKRQGLKSSIVNYVGVLLGVIFFNFVFPNIIDKEYLGLIGLLQNITIIIAVIPALALPALLLKYHAHWKENTPETIPRFNALALGLMFLAMLITTAIYLACKQTIISYYYQQSPLIANYFYIVIPMVLIILYNSYFDNYALVKMRSAVPGFLREIVLRVLLITLVFLFAKKYITEQQFMIGLPMVYLIPFCVLLYYVVSKLNFKAKQPMDYVKGNILLPDQIKYTSTMYIYFILVYVNNFLDGIILPAYLGLGALGIYLRPFLLGQMIMVPFRAIGQIASPVIREAFANNDIEKVASLNKSIGLNLFFIGSFLFTMLIVNTDGLFSLLPAEYAVAKNVLYIIGLGRLLDMAFGLNSEIIVLSDAYKAIVWLTGIMIALSIFLNIQLIPKYGMIGAAIVVAITVAVFNFCKTIYVYRKYKFHCFSKHYLSLISVSVFVIIVLQQIPLIGFIKHHMFLNSVFNIVFKTSVGMILFIVPAYYLNISKDFND